MATSGESADDHVTSLFSTDPQLLSDLAHHRTQDVRLLLRRLEVIHNHSATWRSDQLSEEVTRALINRLVQVYMQTADNIKISRAVEKLWQPFLEQYSQYVYVRLEGHVIETMDSDWSVHQSFTKVSAILEHSHVIQRIFRDQVSRFTSRLATQLERLLQIRAELLSVSQSQCLLAVIKICLQMFQVCQSELGTRLWATGSESGNQELGTRLWAAGSERGNQSLRSVVESLVLILCTKGHHTDCVLLCGTALALVLNSAPDLHLAITVFHNILAVSLNSGGNASFDELCQPMSNSCNTMTKLGSLTVDQLGAVAFIRGVVTCGRADLLTTVCTDPDLQLHGHSISASTNNPCKLNRDRTVDAKQGRLLLCTLFDYIHAICQGEITLHYHSFQVLLLWYTRLSKLPSCLEILLPATEVSSSVKSSSVTDPSSSVKSSSVTDPSSTVKSSFVTDSSSSVKSSSVTDPSSTVKSSFVTDSSSSVKSSSVTDSSSTVKSSSVTDFSSILESTLQLVMLNWDSPVEDVPEAVGDIFGVMMSVWSKVKGQIPDLPERVLDVLVRTPWYVKGKYRILAALLKFVDTRQVLTDHTEIQSQLLECLTTNHLASASTAVYKAFMQELISRPKVECMDGWTNEWMNTVVEGLISKNSSLRYNTSLYWVPVTLKLLPQTADVLQCHLVEMMGDPAADVCHTRLLHAWIGVARATRTLTGRADLADPHVEEALYSADEDVRSEALALVCTTLKKSERISDIEVGLLKNAIPYNIKIDSAPFRQYLGSYIRKLLVRLRDSCITLLKAPDKNKQDLDCALGFVDWLHDLCMSYLLPGASYQRRKGSLDILQVIYECLVYCPTSRQRKAFTPESTTKLVDLAIRSGRWQFFCATNRATLVQCTLDGADEIQSAAYHLLTKYYPWSHDQSHDQSHDRLCCHLLEESLRLCNSPKGHEGQSGAVLCKLVFQKFAIEKDYNFQLSFCEEKSAYIVSVSSVGECSDVSPSCTGKDSHNSGKDSSIRGKDSSIIGKDSSIRGKDSSITGKDSSIRGKDSSISFLNTLLSEIHRCQSEAEKNLVKASKLYPIHGLMSAMCQCVTDTTGLWEEPAVGLVGVVEKLIDTCHNLIHKMLGIMASVAEQEACPSFAEIGVALERMLLEDQSDYSESTSQSPEFQYMLSWCWNNINESCTTLGELTRVIVKHSSSVSPATLQQICTTFQTVLTKCRHKGVIEGCRNAFIRFCTALFSSDRDMLHRIPADILSEVLDGLKNRRMNSSVTRRSAGLPIIVQAVLTSGGKLKKTSLLTSALASLFDICAAPLGDDTGVTDLPQVHGLNILDALFRDASLTPSLVGYTSRAVILVIQQFGSPSWAVRNAATRLFSTLVTRIFGQKKSSEDSLCNTVTFVEFSSYYPELPPFLLAVLTEASVRDVRKICDLHPGIFPVMTVLACLKPMDTSEESVVRELKTFEDKLRPFLASPVYQIRHLVAPAYVAMVTVGHMKGVAVGCLETSVGGRENEFICKDLNLLHGKLLLFHRCLDHVSSVSDLDDLWTHLCLRAWLSSAALCLVSAQYVCCLHRLVPKYPGLSVDQSVLDPRLVQKHPGLSVDQSVLDRVLQECCHGNTQQIGGGVFSEEGVGFLCTAYRQSGRSIGDLLITCLASTNQDTRRAGLQHLLSESDWLKHESSRITTGLCQHLHTEQHIPNVCMVLQLITSLCLATPTKPPSDADSTSDWFSTTIPPDDRDHISDWFSKNCSLLLQYTSLAAAALPVKGILVRHWLDSDCLEEHAASITHWCETVKEFSLLTNETQRLSAVHAVLVAGDSLLSLVAGDSLLSMIAGDSLNSQTVGRQTRERWAVSILSACLTLIQDEDCDIRAEACKFVSRQRWPRKSVQYSSIHSNVCYELLLEYVSDKLWWSTEVIHFLTSQLYQTGEIDRLLKEKSASRYQQLFDQEDNSFFSERIYNSFSVHKTLKAIAERCQKECHSAVLELLQGAGEDMVEDTGLLVNMLASVKQGSIINVCCDNAVVASVCGLLLLNDVVATVTKPLSMAEDSSECVTSLVRGQIRAALQLHVLPASLQKVIEEMMADGIS